MNKKNLIITSTKGMSREDWLAYRNPLNHVVKFIQEWNVTTYGDAEKFFKSEAWETFYFPCVGGSEVATVMGLDPYKASIEVFYSKTGVKPFEDFDKQVMFWGRELEEQIAQKWQFWEGDVETMMANFKAKKIVRKCNRVNAYLRNKKFPWIFVSLDRAIKKWGKAKQSGVLECKTMSEWVAKMWENGLPPQYLVQAQIQMAVCEEVFGEIAYLKDGRSFDVLSFDFSESIANAVIEKTRLFFEKVKKGLEHFILHSFAAAPDVKQAHLHEIDMLAPEPDGSEGYKNYLSARYLDKDYGKPGGEREFAYAEAYDDCNREFKLIEAKQLEASNNLKAFMGEANTIDFGARGKVTWKENNKGSRTFRVSIKRGVSAAYEDTKQLIKADENYLEYETIAAPEKPEEATPEGPEEPKTVTRKGAKKVLGS